MRYDNESMSWSKTTRRLNHFWNEIKNDTKHNSNFGKVDLVFYPNLSFKNYTIYHIYQSLFTICPALEVSLWPGAKFSYQVRIPLFNDGYDESESYIHPGFVTISQKFRDPFNLNILGKFTFGTYNNNVYGASLDLAYHFPNERFWVDGQVALLGKSYYKGFELHYDKMNSFYWNFAVNYYMPILKTQFLIRAQKFLAGDKGLKFEMIRHNKRSSVGLYAEKSIDTRFNVGFRFQFTLSPHHKIRRSNSLKITTGPQMGISYNAGNERVNYKEFRNEAVVNIMSNNYYNPYYLDSYFN